MRFDPTKMKPGWSMSRLKAFSLCPLRWAWLYVDGRKEPIGDAALKGSVAHAVTAEYRIRWLESGADCRHSGHLDRIAEAAGREEGASPAAIAEGMELAIHALNHMAALTPDRDQVAQWWVEERIAFDHSWGRIIFNPADTKWWGSKTQRAKTWFRCIPDFAWLDRDGVLHVEDDKTGWGQNDPAQTQAYGFCVAKLLPRPPERIETRFNLLGQGKVTQPEVVTPHDVAGFPKWLQSQVDTVMGTTEFEPKLGRACSWCGFGADCPAQSKALAEVAALPADRALAVTTHDEAVQVGLLIMAVEARLKLVKDAARRWVEENGPVTLPETGKELRVNPMSVREAMAGDVLGALVALGCDKGTILDRIKLGPKDAENVLKGVWPLSGEGVAGEIRERNRQARREAEAQMEGLWTEKPRRGVFGVFGEREEDR